MYYSRYGGSSETRLLSGDSNRAANLRLFVDMNLALSSQDVTQENTTTYGPGIEIRPFAQQHCPLSRQQSLDWITRTRFFAEHLNQTFNKDPNPAWNPRNDTLVGFDMWRAYGAVDPDRPGNSKSRWAELYVGAAYHTTDFYTAGYDSVRTGFDLKAGIKRGRSRLPFMPYAEINLNTTSRQTYFWENSLLGGIGIRTQIKAVGEDQVYAYVEGFWLLDYLKDEPAVSWVSHIASTRGVELPA